jgi:predicted phage tail protein
LRWGSTYYYRVAAFISAGGSSYATTNATTLPYPPAAPSGLVASVVSFDRVDLSWTDNAANETAFLIERSTNGVSFVQIARLGPNVTAFSDTGLTASTTYYYRVRATDSGRNSAYSNTAFATTGLAVPPAAPSNLALTVVSSSQINLQWQDNSSNEVQFVIECSLDKTSFTPIASLSANAQNYSAIGLQANNRYYFRVRAMNSAGNSAYSNVANDKTLH